MNQHDTDAEELVTPYWRDGNAYAQAHGCTTVLTTVREVLSDRGVQDGKSNDAVSRELDTWFPSLLARVRITDLKDNKYWLYMFMVCFVFIMLELGVITGSNVKSEQLARLQSNIIYFLLIPTVIFVAISWFASMVAASGTKTLPRALLWCRPKYLHLYPIIWLSIGMMGVNFWLIYQTGMRDSPFLPAFLATALTVIGLPRENSGTVVVLSIVAVAAAVLSCFIHGGYQDDELESILKSWDAGATGNLQYAINALTVLVSAVLSLILRTFTIEIKATTGKPNV